MTIYNHEQQVICENIPEVAQTTHHHHLPPLNRDKSSPGPMDLSSSHETEI